MLLSVYISHCKEKLAMLLEKKIKNEEDKPYIIDNGMFQKLLIMDQVNEKNKKFKIKKKTKNEGVSP